MWDFIQNNALSIIVIEIFVLLIVLLFRNNGKTDRIISIMGIGFAFVSVILSAIITSRSTIRVNRKEFQLVENMKSDLWDLTVTIWSIDRKARKEGCHDFSYEKNSLRKIQESPGYHILLFSIDKDDREDFENGVQQLIKIVTSGGVYDSIRNDSIRNNIKGIKIILAKNNSSGQLWLKRIGKEKWLKHNLKTSYEALLDEICLDSIHNDTCHIMNNCELSDSTNDSINLVNIN